MRQSCWTWRAHFGDVYGRIRQHARESPQTLSDHLLADVGLESPRYELPTWERHIHRH